MSPIYANGVLKMLNTCFLSPRARLVWKHLGLIQMVKSACVSDRAGQVVLEYIFCTEQHIMSTFGSVSIPEIFAVASWYWYL
jgi:hypothetical protein